MDNEKSISPQPILFFDGVCNLCNSSVQFVIRHDKKNQFLFAQLQTPAGQKALANTDIPSSGKESVILHIDGKYYTRSSAALHTLRLLGWPWATGFVFIIVPKPVRDAVYNFISRNRYRWFGKKDHCMIPTPDLTKRFIIS